MNRRHLIISLLSFVIWSLNLADAHASHPKSESGDIHNASQITFETVYEGSDFEDLECVNRVYKDNIHTPLVHHSSTFLGSPYLRLNDGSAIEVHFDDLDTDFKDFQYTVVHCDANWYPSDLDQSDYMTGFYENDVSNYDQSFNTIIDYTHYDFTFPNDMSGISISGNYLLIVYEDGDLEDLVFTHRFVVYEELVGVNSRVKEPTIVADRRYNQEVDFTIVHPDYDIYNPYSDLQVVVLQNNRWDNAVTDLKPRFVKDREIVYDYDEENNFPGGNEYRDFDLKDFDYISMRFDSLSRQFDGWHAYLRPYDKRSFDRYSSFRDINGRFAIVNDDGPENHLDADYAYVHFTLPYDHPLVGGELFVFGQLTQNTFPQSHRMLYNGTRKAYEATILVKQGFYNYVYMFLPKNSEAGDIAKVEGSHFQTSNEYTIFVYNFDYNLGCDRVIGAKFTDNFNQ